MNAGFQPSTVAPENGSLEDDPFLLGFSLFSGANLLLVSGRVYFPMFFFCCVWKFGVAKRPPFIEAYTILLTKMCGFIFVSSDVY